MRKFLLAAAAALPLIAGGAAVRAQSFQNATGGSMYLPQKEFPNALENSIGDSQPTRRGALIEGRSVFEAVPTFAGPRVYVAPENVGPALIGRSTHQGDNF